MNALGKIADYSRNYDGEDEVVVDIRLSTDDLRFIANLNVQLGRARASERIVDYMKRRHFDLYSQMLDEMALDR